MKAISVLLVAAVCVVALAGGCSSNDGGDTACKDFVTHDQQTQNAEIATMLKDQKGADASGMEITATRLSALAFCNSTGKPDSTISDINHG